MFPEDVDNTRPQQQKKTLEADKKRQGKDPSGQKKKKKKEIELENALDTKNVKTLGLCTEVESEQSDTVKKKKKKKSKYQLGEASKAALHPGVDYLRTWHFDRRNWNFKKVRQVWLLQNMFDQEQVSKVIQ